MLRTKLKNKNWRAITLKVLSVELWFLCIALFLNEIYLPMKFHVNALHSFKVMLRTKKGRTDWLTDKRTDWLTDSRTDGRVNYYMPPFGGIKQLQKCWSFLIDWGCKTFGDSGNNISIKIVFPEYVFKAYRPLHVKLTVHNRRFLVISELSNQQFFYLWWVSRVNTVVYTDLAFEFAARSQGAKVSAFVQPVFPSLCGYSPWSGLTMLTLL